MERKGKPGQLEDEKEVKNWYGPDKVKEGHQLALLGLTDREMAKVWELSPETVYGWKTRHPEFREAVSRGRVRADARVAVSLYRRAVGYWHIEYRVNATGGKIHVTPVKKYIPPDVEAIKYFLSMRQREKWSQKYDGESQAGHIVRINLKDVAEEDLHIVNRIQMKYFRPTLGRINITEN